MKTIFVSFYTKEGDYKLFADNLRNSLLRFNLENEIIEIPSLDCWSKNNSLKAEFILKMVLKHKCKVVWLDCDCEICEFPALLINENYDFAIYRWVFKDGKVQEREVVFKDDQPMFSGGVMAFSYSAPGLDLLIRWVFKVREDRMVREDQVLDQIYQKHIRLATNPIKIEPLWLPKSYNRMDTHWPTVKPVINHYFQDGRIFSGELRFNSLDERKKLINSYQNQGD